MMDISETAFSYYGAYMALKFQYDEDPKQHGLFLQSLRGKSKSHMNVLKIVPTIGGAPIEFDYIADRNELTLRFQGGEIYICFDGHSRILFKGHGDQVGLQLDTQPIFNFEYNYLLGNIGKEYCIINSYKNLTKFMVLSPQGTVSLNQDLFIDSRGSTNEANNQSIIEMKPDGRAFLGVIEDIPTHITKPEDREYNFEKALENSKKSFDAFYQRFPKVPEKYQDTLLHTVYIIWSNFVRAEGYLKRDTMFVSNNRFLGAWGWDHCFHALGVLEADPQLAYDQMAILFDHQDDLGQIPGSVSDSTIRWNFAKPPIHGLFYSKMMKKMDFSTEQIETVYDQIEKQVNFYLTYKDSNEDGICEYHHGNDSGQDNSTVFRDAAVIDSPDLTAFLIKGMDMLAEVAEKLNKLDEKAYWEKESKRLTDLFVEYFIVDNLPAARMTRTKEVIESDSVLPLISLVIADKLPNSIHEKMISTITGERYLTKWGIATEAIDSPLYEDDAYWRGAIWAPTTLILVDALEDCGETEVALEVAEKYCELVARNGFSENFNALTGEGLRDNSFSWTASTFVYLASKLEQAKSI